MKKTITIFAVLFFTGVFCDSISQTYNGTFQELFFGWQQGARAEAMGRSFASVSGDALSYSYNPAGMASLEGLNLSGSFAGPYYLLDTAKYNYFSASYKIKKYGTVGFSRDYFTYGYDVIVTDEFGNVTGKYEPHVTNFRLTLSSEVIKDLLVGINLNLLQERYGSDISIGNERSGNNDVFYIDLGVIKSFNIQSMKMNHKINIGSSLININSAEYGTDASQGDKLPVILRLGASYVLSVKDKSIVKKLNSYNVLVNAEYEDLLNSKYYGGFHSGLEFTFLEMLSLRGGYYTREIDDNCINCKDKLSEFTYGFGLNIPVRQLSDSHVPLEVNFDYINLKQPSYITNKDDWNNFHVYTIRVNWIF